MRVPFSANKVFKAFTLESFKTNTFLFMVCMLIYFLVYGIRRPPYRTPYMHCENPKLSILSHKNYYNYSFKLGDVVITMVET